MAKTCYAKEMKAIYSMSSTSSQYADPYVNPQNAIQGDGVLHRSFFQYDLSEIPY